MNKKFLIYFIVLISLGSILYRIHTLYKPYLDVYTQIYTEQLYGSQHASPAYETMIRTIAQEMDITEPFEIRKMNTYALQTFGYWNALVYFPRLFNCIPISNKPFLFISQSFFDDLTPEEQRFLIGHELIHIKEHHFQYFNLVLYLVFIMFLLISWKISKYICKFFKSFQKKYVQRLGIPISTLLLYISLVISNLIALAYVRHIEWQADCISLELLNTYNGGIRFMDRLNQDFNMPLHHKLGGLFVDHPSVHERKVYFTNVKNIKESNSCSSKNC